MPSGATPCNPQGHLVAVRWRPAAEVLAGAALAVIVGGCVESQPSASATPRELDTEAVASALIDFARARDERSFADLRFATHVALALGGDVRQVAPGDELIDPGVWLIDPGPDGFRDRVGPFSALDVVADAGAVTMSDRRHGSCTEADEPLPPPPELADLRVVSLQPDRAGMATCTQRWAVDIFMTDSGRIAGVDLDLGAP